MSTNEPPQDKASFLQRPSTVVGLVSGVVTIVAGVVGLVLQFRDTSPNTDAMNSSKRVQECMSSHALSQPHLKQSVSEERHLFRSCVWPPPRGADADGYSEIAVATRPGPGRSEAEGLTVADVFDSRCLDIEARYLFDNQGTFVPEQPLRLTKGEVRRVEGGSVWRPRTAQEEAEFAPRRDQTVVMSNHRYALDTARCV